MNDEQRYAFDTWGFLVLENVLAPDQVERLCATANEHGGQTGTQLLQDGGFWSQDFVDLLDVPVVSDVLDELYGGEAGDLPAWRIDHINVHTHGVFNRNLAGGRIHNHNQWLREPDAPKELQPLYYERDVRTGRFRNGLVAVAYELEDTVCNGGGFCCLAGSHKTAQPVPPDWVDMADGVHPMMTRVPARPGTAILFTEALSHGTLPWTVPNRRTTLFYKYTPKGEAYTGPERFFAPEGADGWDNVTERTRAILSPPPAEWVERRAAIKAERA
jgi:hypothetical protein